MDLATPLYSSWIVGTFVICLVGIWLCKMPNSVPKSIVPVLIYGKSSNEWLNHSFAQWLQVPKKWFLHFYIFAVIQNVIVLTIMCGRYMLSTPVPNAILEILDFVKPTRQPSVEPLSAFLAMVLVLFHTGRRLYECLYVSVYSPSYMNALHYILGYLFYHAVTLTLLCEIPGFHVPPVQDTHLGSFHWFHITGIVLFIFGSYHHHMSHVILANLRKDVKGTIINTQHFIPSGGLFEYVSCPHYFAEILIYLALAFVLELRHMGWWLVFAWTLGGQVVTALSTHSWYLQKYKEYPKFRKAIVPFLL